MGFSSMISMLFLLTRPGLIVGVIAQSRYIPLQSGIEVDEARVKGKPIIMNGIPWTRHVPGEERQSSDFSARVYSTFSN